MCVCMYGNRMKPYIYIYIYIYIYMIIIVADSRQHFTLLVSNGHMPDYKLTKFMNSLLYIIQEPTMQISITKTYCYTLTGLLLCIYI